jgi:L-histidine N-alpha-methyltransferase
MNPTVTVLLSPADLLEALQADVRDGLSAEVGWRTLPPKWFYDEHGSDLFDQITRLPEYYPTRRERSVLADKAASIMSRGQISTLIELGSGTSDKTKLLLDAGLAGGALERFVPFDVSEETLRSAAAALASRYPALSVEAIVGDFERHLPALSSIDHPGQRLVVFLGGTIGNLQPGERAEFFQTLSSALAPGDRLLLGTDLVKDPGRLVAAYDDAAGVTAEFNRNVLSVINRELSADFDVSSFEHVAIWDPTEEWIEMRLRTANAQVVTISDLGLKLSFEGGEEIRTEISAKFRRPRVQAELSASGFVLDEWWTDPDGDFGVSFSHRTA